MYINSLEELYTFLEQNIEIPNLSTDIKSINLVPLSNIDYRNKIRGAIISLAIGDAFGSYLEGQHQAEVENINYFLKGERNYSAFKGTWQTQLAVLFAESLIINQSFNPEDLANRFIRQPIIGRYKSMEEFITNYRDHRLKWYESGVSSMDVNTAIRGLPVALINYGDFNTLKLTSAIQTVITNVNETSIAASISFLTAVSYLLNTPEFSIENENDINLFIDTISQSIYGIENRVYPISKNGDIANLYTMINKVLKEWLSKDLTVKEVKDHFGSSSNVLESIPISLYIFLKNLNNYETTLKECLINRETDTIVTMVLTLLGAYLGFNNIPRGYIKKIEANKEILTLSDRLFELSLKNNKNNPYRRMRDQEGIEKSKDKLDKLLWLGIKYNKNEEYEKAIESFEEFIKKGSELEKNKKIKLHIIEAYEGLGNKLLEEEDYKNALKFMKKALIYDLNNHIILCNIAVIYLYMNDLTKAEKYAQRAVECSPEYEIGREILEGIKSLLKNN